MKVVILAGGTGTRMKEETDFKPKPMVEVGNSPLLLHLMRCYMRHRFKDFIICLGYKGEMIRRFFFEYPMMRNEVTLSNTGRMTIYADPLRESEQFDVTLVDTGLDNLTGTRVKKVSHHLGNDPVFLCTYGDGLSDVNIQDVLASHYRHGKLATCVVTRPNSRYGVVGLQSRQSASDAILGPLEGICTFSEKPKSTEWINAGFFVFNREVADVCEGMLEDTLRELAEGGQLMAYRHEGFFASCDTSKDLSELNELWKKGDAPWST